MIDFFFSPDENENPFAGKLYFLLSKKSDQRKLLSRLIKNQFYKKDCNKQLDKLLDK
jgi:hypothetical protein